MSDLPGPGLEPMSPTLTGGFLTTGPPGKSKMNIILILVAFKYTLEQKKSICHSVRESSELNVILSISFPLRTGLHWLQQANPMEDYQLTHSP